ncbi:hypothetical protein EDD22DRAFT_1006250 [Suillus occidentalis]|nr:hypothetical protein EDD22DRAFT_1006250 [Suillus occidentalis]
MSMSTETLLAVTRQGMDHIKNLVLDLLSWGVSPEYLVEAGVSTGVSYRVFTDLKLRLPTNLLLDCRRNNISDISVPHNLPKLQILYADHNSVHALHLSIGPSLSVLDASHNDITFLKFTPSSPPQILHTLTLLHVSHAKLSSLDAFNFSQLPALQTLKLDHNELRTLPDSLGELSHLIHLSCCDNKLVSLLSASFNA